MYPLTRPLTHPLIIYPLIVHCDTPSPNTHPLSHSLTITVLQSGLDEATRRLRSYEDLENEIDEAIVRSGQESSHSAAANIVLSKFGPGAGVGVGLGRGEGRGGDRGEEEWKSRDPSDMESKDKDSYLNNAYTNSPTDLLQLIRGLPTNPERRIKQCVHLAQRLLEAEGQRDEAKRRMVVAENEMKSMKVSY